MGSADNERTDLAQMSNIIQGEDSEEDEEETVPAPIVIAPVEGAPKPSPEPVDNSHLPLLSSSVAPISAPAHDPDRAHAEPRTAMQHRLRERNNAFRMSLGRRVEQILGGIKYDLSSCSKMFVTSLESVQDTNQTVRALNIDVSSLCDNMEQNQIADGPFAFLSRVE